MARGESSKEAARRRILIAVPTTLVVLAACCAAVITFGSDGSSTELLSSVHKAARLAFGDASFRPSQSAASQREGSVRGTIKPDFSPPIGSLGSTGLHDAGSIEKLSLRSISHKAGAVTNPMLAFGDADGFKAPQDQAAREGGVRNGIKPDFHPPLGDLGKVGLAKGSAHIPAQALANAPSSMDKTGGAHKAASLAFGDASFQPSAAPDREGSVGNGKRPDFEPPIGDLGEVGLKSGAATALVQKHKQQDAPSKDASLSALQARQDMDNYFAQQSAAIKRLEVRAKARKAPVTSNVAMAQLSNFFSSLQTKAANEHAHIISQQLAHEQSSGKDMSNYFDSVEKKDALMHQQALQREHREDAAMRALEAKDNASAVKAKAPKTQAVTGANGSRKAPTEALAGEGLGGIFGQVPANKHGFHAIHMAHNEGVRKQLEDAKRIAKNDLNDCAFTLC